MKSETSKSPKWRRTARASLRPMRDTALSRSHQKRRAHGTGRLDEGHGSVLAGKLCRNALNEASSTSKTQLKHNQPTDADDAMSEQGSRKRRVGTMQANAIYINDAYQPTADKDTKDATTGDNPAVVLGNTEAKLTELKNGVAANFSFGDITFNKPGTYTFNVTESNAPAADANGMTYDRHTGFSKNRR